MLNTTAVVKQLQEMRDEGYLSDALLRYAVKSIASSSDKYNWVGAFLVKDGAGLWLHNYVGEPAQYAEVAVGTGVGGIAVADRKNQNVPDVAAWEGYQPCAADIRSELVVLIRAGDEVLGEIDVASESAGAFSGDDEKAVQAICDKLAEQIASERR
jgi:GAF domain-containing protein